MKNEKFESCVLFLGSKLTHGKSQKPRYNMLSAIPVKNLMNFQSQFLTFANRPSKIKRMTRQTYVHGSSTTQLIIFEPLTNAHF